MPAISVIIPVLNGERYLEETIRSVFAQTYPPCEIIVVDDGSRDGSAEIVRRMSGPVPLSYNRQQHQGQSAARNAGVALARGDWIAFLDQDDVWHPEKLAVQVECMQGHPEVSFFYSAQDFVDEAGRLLTTPRWVTKPDPLFQDRPPASPSTVLLKKALFLHHGGFNPLLRIGEDGELFARIALTTPIRYISRSLVKYRRHSAQSSKNKQIWVDSWPMYHQCSSELWRDNPKKQAILAERTAAVYADLGRHYLRTGDYDKAREFFRQSFSLRPWSWSNLRRWGLSYLPGVREWYRSRKTKPKTRMAEQ